VNEPSTPPADGSAPRILHLVSSGRWTGVADPATSVAMHQQNLGCKVWFSCCASRTLEIMAKKRGLNVPDICYLERSVNPFRLLSDVLKVARFIREKDINVIHCHLVHDHWLAALARRIVPGPKLLVRSFHRGVLPRADIFHRWLYRAGSDVIITVSESAKKTFHERLKISDSKVIVAYGAVDADTFHPSRNGADFRRELGVPEDAALCGIVARMSPNRGHFWLLESFKDALEKMPDLRLAMIGRGPEKRRIAAHIAQMGLSGKVLLPGFQDPEILPDVCAALDFHILLAQGSEGSCRAVLETMAAGVASIAVDEGALSETITHGVDGLLVERGNRSQLAGAIVRMAGDREKTKAMGREARKTIEARFVEKRRTETILRAYQEAWPALKGAGAAPPPEFGLSRAGAPGRAAGVAGE
jgi:glycosyltransferase involved in cell wall biosynthesis